MEFSVVIPCCNNAQTLPRALNSIAQQNHKNIEVVLVDDGSTDNTAEVAKQYQNNSDLKIQLLQQENQGPGAARNLGIKQSQGKYLVFLDADDSFTENAFSTFKKGFSQSANTQMVIAGYRAIHAEKQKINMPKKLAKTPQKKLKCYLMGNFNINMGTVAIEKHSLGNIRFPTDVRNGEDTVFYSHCLSLLRCECAPEVVVNIYHQKNSLRNQHQQVLDTGMKIPELIFSRPGLPKAIYKLANPYTARKYMSLAKVANKIGKKEEAKKLLLNAIKVEPALLLRIGTYKLIFKISLRPKSF